MDSLRQEGDKPGQRKCSREGSVTGVCRGVSVGLCISDGLLRRLQHRDVGGCGLGDDILD